MTVQPRYETSRQAHPSRWAASEMTSSPARSGRSLPHHSQLLEAALIVGLAGVFLVNSIVAVSQPSEFMELVERSLVGRAIPTMSGRWVAWVITVHDLAIGILLLASMWIPRARPFVLAWAGAWLLAVALVKLTALDAFGG